MHRTTGYICDSDAFYSSPTFAVLHAKTTDEGWNPYTLVILVEITLFLHVQNERWGLGPTETSNSDANYAVLYAQNDRSCLGPIESCNSSPKVAVLNAKTTDKGWDPERQVILVLITMYCMHKTTGDVWDT